MTVRVPFVSGHALGRQDPGIPRSSARPDASSHYSVTDRSLTRSYSVRPTLERANRRARDLRRCDVRSTCRRWIVLRLTLILAVRFGLPRPASQVILRSELFTRRGRPGTTRVSTHTEGSVSPRRVLRPQTDVSIPMRTGPDAPFSAFVVATRRVVAAWRCGRTLIGQVLRAGIEAAPRRRPTFCTGPSSRPTSRKAVRSTDGITGRWETIEQDDTR